MIRLPVYFLGEIVAHTTIDDADAHLAQYRWRLSNGYAVRSIGKRDFALMHNDVMNAKGVDHRDRNRLNNRRSNLRVVTQSQNNQNRPACPDRVNASERTSVYRGVQWNRQNQCWYAFVTVDGKRHSAGHRFDDELEAALAAEELRADLNAVRRTRPSHCASNGPTIGAQK